MAEPKTHEVKMISNDMISMEDMVLGMGRGGSCWRTWREQALTCVLRRKASFSSWMRASLAAKSAAALCARGLLLGDGASSLHSGVRDRVKPTVSACSTTVEGSPILTLLNHLENLVASTSMRETR